MLLKRISKLNVYSFFSIGCILALGLMTIIGCSSGGDGGAAPAPAPAPISYTGLTTQASVDTDVKAQALAAGAFGAGQTGAVINGIGAVETGTDEHIISFRTLKVTQALEDALLQVDLSSLYNGPFVGATQSTGDIRVDGSCGGYAIYNITYDDVSGDFSGSFDFNNLLDCGGVPITGKTTIKGRLDLASGTFITITFTFTNLTDGSSTMSGYIYMDFIGSPTIVNFDGKLRIDSTGKVYWANDYNMEISEGFDIGSYVEVEISSGKYYDPDYGYVDVLTLAPFRINDGDEYPSSGILLVTGNNNTEARLEALDADTCQITADTDGDLVYDYDSGVLNWTDL